MAVPSFYVNLFLKRKASLIECSQAGTQTLTT
nr:MAG TPA: hypothetical protein [Caudoviricetes sp.]